MNSQTAFSRNKFNYLLEHLIQPKEQTVRTMSAKCIIYTDIGPAFFVEEYPYACTCSGFQAIKQVDIFSVWSSLNV